MATDKQYRPLSTAETAADASLSTRQIRDLADGVENYVRHVANFKIISLWGPDVGDQTTPWMSHDSTTDERVVGVFAGVLVPDGYTQYTTVAGHKRTAGADDILWKLYSTGYLYDGGPNLDATRLSPDYDWITVTTDSDTHAIDTQQSLDVLHGFDGFNFFVLTATNGDGSTRGCLTTLDVFPVI